MCENTVCAHAGVPFSARLEFRFGYKRLFSDFQARLAGLKILARFENTGLGISARAELRPGLNPSPCNRQFGFQRICFRSRAEILGRSAGLNFQSGMKFAMLSGPKTAPNNLRADVWNFGESGASREISNFFIFCPTNIYSQVSRVLRQNFYVRPNNAW